MQEFISKYTFPNWMCDGSKPQPFGNDRHTIFCGFLTIMWFSEILEGRDLPCGSGRPEFDGIGKTLVTMLRFTRHICNCANVVDMDSGFCVTKGLVKLLKKGVFGAVLIKKRRYCLENINGDAIDTHFSSKEVGSVYAVK